MSLPSLLNQILPLFDQLLLVLLHSSLYLLSQQHYSSFFTSLPGSLYMTPPTFPFAEPNEDKTQAAAPPSCPIFFKPLQDQGGNCDAEQLKHHQQLLHDYDSYGGSIHENRCGPKLLFPEEDDNQSANGSIKWMSSKMRLMRKMMNSERMVAEDPIRTTKRFQDRKQPLLFHAESRSNNSSNNNTIRVCVDCNTTKTPLWRGGPRGPKSLCNACGIRQRKARRAMAAAVASGTDTSLMGNKLHYKGKKLDKNHAEAYKKGNDPPGRRKKLCFEDFTVSLSKNSAFHGVFPQDEKEAAILLMALSCGLVNS